MAAKQYFKHAEWDVRIHENGDVPTGPNWRREMGQLLPRLEDPDEILKSDHRSDVGLVKIGEVLYAVKKFNQQHDWFWFRFTSMFFPSLGEIAARNSLQLADMGIRTPRPTLLMQSRKLGMIRGSWLVYRFMDGEELTAADAPEIVAFVKDMHHRGWVHLDPHPANFIRTPDGIATIDPIKARHTRNPYLRAYDVLLMENAMPDAFRLYGMKDLIFWYLLAKGYHNWLRLFRFVKKALRQALGISLKE